MIESLGAASYALLWLALIFIPLEWARPMWPQQLRLRQGLATDLAFFAGQHLVFGAAVAWLLMRGFELVPRPEWLVGAQAVFARQPSWLQGIEVVVLGDLTMYWGHRLQHHNALLWRFHAIHHTSERLDFVAAHREHPIDGLYTQLLMNVPAVLLGFSFEGLLGLVAFRGLWATFIHSNVKLPLGPLAMLFGSPEHHHLHHLRRRDIGNYANLAPWIDWLFGTHRTTVEPATDLGLDTPAPRGYLGLLAYPFVRRVKLSAMTHAPRQLFVAAFAASVCLNLLACLDPKATYEPRSGVWRYEEEAVVSNTCDSQVASDNPNPLPSMFNLDYDEGDEFQVEQGEDDIVCEIDREEFFCSEFKVGPNQVLTFDAFITYAVRWEGEFTSDSIADGRSTSAITCTGEDCALIDGLPCAREVTFTAEFVN